MDSAVYLESHESPSKRLNLIVRAVRDGGEIAPYHSLSCAAFARDSSLEDWCFCGGLYAIKNCPSRNLGRYLLELSLLELRGIGYRHAAISTALCNYRAALFCSNYDYRIIDCTYGQNKKLKV